MSHRRRPGEEHWSGEGLNKVSCHSKPHNGFEMKSSAFFDWVKVYVSGHCTRRMSQRLCKCSERLDNDLLPSKSLLGAECALTLVRGGRMMGKGGGGREQRAESSFYFPNLQKRGRPSLTTTSSSSSSSGPRGRLISPSPFIPPPPPSIQLFFSLLIRG